MTCPIRERLGSDLEDAHRAITEWSTREIEALIKGDPVALAWASGEVTKARECRDKAVHAFQEHAAEHGCTYLTFALRH